ncbi:MAG: sigma-54-dependent Fis family transcriptional regulator, partial [Chitinophagales bacterium]|nr:sigma-54-dependent Fis family transcriptional regulator [Chitinophagales bacterium]
LSEDRISDDEVKTFVTNTQSKQNPTELFNRFDRFHDFKEFIEKKFIEHKLTNNNWNVSKTAEVLDIQRSHLYNKIEKFELKRT